MRDLFKIGIIENKYILELEHIRREILGLFRRGKISDAYYNILDKKTTDYISLGLNNPDNKDNNSWISALVLSTDEMAYASISETLWIQSEIGGGVY